jgi:hypothetical protein
MKNWKPVRKFFQKSPTLVFMNAINKRLEIQKDRAWDIEKDLPWFLGCDVRCDLVPIDENFALLPGITARERLVLGQGIGILAAKAISEHERVLNLLKDKCWARTLGEGEASSDLFEMGEQFFTEEAKHSQAFARYVEKFAHAHHVSVDELNAYLPQYDENSFITSLYKLDAQLGGKALWWTVAATEEESIELYKSLHAKKDHIDPLFYTLNRLHFEEEVRHSSYAYDILKLKPRSFFAGLLQRSDFLFSRVLQAAWLFKQLRRFRGISALGHHDPFFAELGAILDKMNSQPLFRQMVCLYKHTEHISLMLNPQKHKKIKKALLLHNVLNLGDL